ncbi:short-chain dehydrogenase/reductase family 9C member 7-like [Stylophora pistillata]|uniref:short-chain dehydrogenase/reductase family 9C member 7-like n=1 Tax=Stylophora pistillata TaxID=50429 RepID=UPI000C04CBBA|nr:short-chain dehydrogenase/reductase family 9C member 7-like [Stylophora pistillata]
MNLASLVTLLPSWVIVVVIGIVTIYFVTYLWPKSRVDLTGMYVLITGCDQGFGRETAIRLDKMGACVIATCLTKEGEQSLRSVASDRLKTFQMDVTNSERIKDVYSEVKKEISTAGLWGLVNNAGIGTICPVEWTPMEVFRRSADVNLWGMIDVTKTFLPLVKRTSGRVVNLSSMAGRFSASFYCSYSVSKYGVEAFSDALRREMLPWGIKVCILEPGSFSTNICAPDVFEQQLREGWNQLSDELKDEYGEEYLKRSIEIMRDGVYRTSNISQVVDAIVEALTSSSPADRYLVGIDAKFLLVWLARLPAYISDFILHLAFNPPKQQAASS